MLSAPIAVCGFTSCVSRHHADTVTKTENQHVHADDGSSHRCSPGNGNDDPHESGNNGKDGRAECYGFEAFEKPHCAECGKDYQSGNKQGTDKIHGQNDDHGDDHGDQQVISIGFNSGGGGEIFIESDGKNFMIKENKNDDDDDGKHGAKGDGQRSQCQDRSRSEKGGADIAGKI